MNDLTAYNIGLAFTRHCNNVSSPLDLGVELGDIVDTPDGPVEVTAVEQKYNGADPDKSRTRIWFRKATPK